jgi:hypothetical protein
MKHCSGGAGANVFGQPNSWKAFPPVSLDPSHNAIFALIDWYKNGNACALFLFLSLFLSYIFLSSSPFSPTARLTSPALPTTTTRLSGSRTSVRSASTRRARCTRAATRRRRAASLASYEWSGWGAGRGRMRKERVKTSSNAAVSVAFRNCERDEGTKESRLSFESGLKAEGKSVRKEKRETSEVRFSFSARRACPLARGGQY